MRYVVALLVLGTVAVLTCAAGLDNRFAGDDFIWLYDASNTHSLLDLFTVHDVAFAPYDGIRLNPTTSAFFAAGWPLFGLRTFGWHAAVLVLYVVTALLIFDWLCQIGVNTAGSLLGALVFATYPQHMEPLAWLSASGEVLVGFFTMLALCAFTRWRRDASCAASKAYMTVTYAAMIAAALAKESGLLVAPILLTLDGMLFPRKSFRIRRHVGLWVVTVMLAVWKSAAIAVLRADVGIHPLEQSATDVGTAMARYLMGAFVGYNHVALFDQRLVLSAAAIIGVIALGAVLWRVGKRRAAFHLCWLLLAVQPYVWWVPDHALYPRYSWQPSLAVAGLAGCLAGWLIERFHGRWMRVFLYSSGLVALSISAWSLHAQVLEWRSTDDSVRLQHQAEQSLSGVISTDRIFVYNDLLRENSGGRALALFGGLAPQQVHDWYEVLATRALSQTDRFVFWDINSREFSDITDSVHLAYSTLQGRLPSGVRPRDAVKTYLFWDFHQPSGRAQWRPVHVADGGALVADKARNSAPASWSSNVTTSGLPLALESSDLNISPFTVLVVQVLARPLQGQYAPLLAWTNDEQSTFDGERVLRPARVDSLDDGTQVATYYPESRVSWWTEGHIRRLILVPSEATATLDMVAVKILMFLPR